MNYLVYKITNQINNKFYIGVHKTANIDDGYLGSGKLIKKAIEKYNQENFQKEILFNFNNSEQMYLKEKELVNEKLLKDPLCYNIKLGGEGQQNHINNNPMSKTHKDAISKGIKLQYIKGTQIGWVKHDGFKGKHHQAEQKLKIQNNNGRKLTKELIDFRIKEYYKLDFSIRGTLMIYANIINLSHTHAKRFINSYIKNN